MNQTIPTIPLRRYALHFLSDRLFSASTQRSFQRSNAAVSNSFATIEAYRVGKSLVVFTTGDGKANRRKIPV